MRLVAIQRWLIAMSELETLAQAASAEIRDTLSLDALDAIRVRLLGKSGVITDQLKALGKLAPEERKAQGEQVNRVKQLLTDLIADRKDTLENAALDAPTRDAAVDDFIGLVGAVDGLLQAQAKADGHYFLRICGRELSAGEVSTLMAELLQAYRWQYIVSGAQDARFSAALSRMVDAGQMRRIEAALAPLAG